MRNPDLGATVVNFMAILESNNKTNLVIYVFQKQRETLPKVLTSFQTVYLTTLDGATVCVTSQSSKRIDFYCNLKEADAKLFAYIKFLYYYVRLGRVTIVLPETDVVVISLHCEKYRNFT